MRFDREATERGRPGKQYWVAFWVTLPVWMGVCALVLALVISSAAKVMTPSRLDKALVQSGAWSSGAFAIDATCVDGNVRSDGSGIYSCFVTFSNGSSQTVQVTVGSNGDWVAGP